MHFKTAAEIKAAKDSSGRNAKREEEQQRKAADRSSMKYERMRLESEKRAAAHPVKPKLVIRPGVIVAPALLAAKAHEASKTEAVAAPKAAVVVQELTVEFHLKMATSRVGGAKC